jgi:carbon monoxide dehydrogenase subunit G
MIVEGKTGVNLPRDVLWTVLSDPRRLGASLPNVGGIQVDDADTVRAVVLADTSIGSTTIPMTFRVLERDEPERVLIEGSGGRGDNAVRLIARLQLATDGDATEVRWRADVSMLGVIGAVGQRAVPWVVRDQVSKVLDAARSVAGGG